MFRVLLNDVESFNQPDGISDLMEKISYSDEFKVYYFQIVGDLTFYDFDFEMLFELFKNNVCQTINIEIQSNENGMSWKSDFKGLVFINEIDFDYEKRSCKAQIVDDSLLSKIINNKDIQVSLSRDFTKNGYDINPCVLSSFNVLDYSGVSFLGRKGVTLFEAMRFIIEYISDGDVGFYSDYLSTNIDAKDYKISDTRGVYGQSVYPRISFDELWSDISNIYNLRAYIYVLNGRNYFRCEPSTFFDESNYSEMPNMKIQNVTSNEDRFFQKAVLGSAKEQTSAPDPIPSWYPLYTTFSSLSFASRKDEAVPAVTCNSDKVITLSMKRLISDNVIINVILNSPSVLSEYDGDVIIWSEFQNVSGNNYYFNREISNEMVLSRWQYDLCLPPGSLYDICESTFLMDSDYNIPQATPGSTYPVSWLNQEEDYCGFGSPVGGGQTITNEAEGFYNINLDIYIRNDDSGPVGIHLDIRVVPPGGGNFFLGFTNLTIASGDTYHFVYTASDILLVAGTLVEFNAFCIDSNDAYIIPESKLSYVSSIQTNIEDSPCSPIPYKATIKGYMSRQEVNFVKNNPFDKVLIPSSFRNITGTIKDLNRNLVTGESNMTIIMRNA